MNRREFLGVAGVAAAMTAGCSTPDSDESESYSAFRSRLEETDVRVSETAEDSTRWILDYFPRRQSIQALLDELELIARIYAETVPSEEAQPTHLSLDLTLLRSNGTRLDILQVLAPWARQFTAGELDQEEYTQLILTTGTLPEPVDG